MHDGELQHERGFEIGHRVAALVPRRRLGDGGQKHVHRDDDEALPRDELDYDLQAAEAAAEAAEALLDARVPLL